MKENVIVRAYSTHERGLKKHKDFKLKEQKGRDNLGELGIDAF